MIAGENIPRKQMFVQNTSDKEKNSVVVDYVAENQHKTRVTNENANL